MEELIKLKNECKTLKEFLAYYCDIRGWVSRKKTGEFGISSPNKQLMRDLKLTPGSKSSGFGRECCSTSFFLICCSVLLFHTRLFFVIITTEGEQFLPPSVGFPGI